MNRGILSLNPLFIRESILSYIIIQPFLQPVKKVLIPYSSGNLFLEISGILTMAGLHRKCLNPLFIRESILSFRNACTWIL